MEEVIKKLKQLKTEDFIWIIYFFIAAFAILSNNYERKYLLNKQNIEAYKKEKTINITVFIVVFFIYLYFVLLISQDLNSMEKNFNNPNYRNTFLKLIASLLFLVGGAIFISQEINSNELDEIGFI